MDQQLINASEDGNVNEVRRLIEAGADPSADNNEAIRWAAMEGHTEVVRLLLADPRVDPTADNNYAIQYAAPRGKTEVVRLLLADLRVDPTADNNFAIRYAAMNGHIEVVQLLLADLRVDPSDKNNAAIRWAAFNGHIEVVRLLLADHRADPSAENNEAIRLAAENGHADVVQLLASQPGVLLPTANYFFQNERWEELKQLASMTGVYSDGQEDLMVWGAAIGSLPLVKSLIEQGVDVTFADNSAMAAAKAYNQQEIVTYLESIMKL